MKEYTNIEETILKVLSGSASDADKDLVNEWKTLDRENSQLFEEYKKTNQIWDNYSLSLKIDTKKALEKINKKIEPQRKEWNSYLIYAKVAAILLPLIVLGALYFYLIQGKPIHKTEITRKIITAYGTRSKIVLSDSSVVWLNAGSSLEFPVVFKGNKREVALIGEAYFDVVKNPEKPFYVEAENMYIKALGTTFNVKAYPGEDRIETTLLTGSVHLVKRKESRETTLAKMKPDQHIIYNKKRNKIFVVKENNEVPEVKSEKIDKEESSAKLPALQAKVETNKHTAWVAGRLIFRNDSMEEIVRRLGRWYNVDIILDDVALKEYSYTATFTDETLEQVLELLKISAPIDYKIEKSDKQNDGTFKKTNIVIRLK